MVNFIVRINLIVYFLAVLVMQNSQSVIAYQTCINDLLSFKTFDTLAIVSPASERFELWSQMFVNDT